MTELDPRLTDEAVQKVLARAVELQAQHAGSLTVAQVRGIAAEMAIPESAVEQALSEYRAASAAALTSPPAPTPVSGVADRASSSRLLFGVVALAGGVFLVLVGLALLVRLFP